MERLKKKPESKSRAQTLYRPEYAKQIYGIMLLGATEKDVARIFDVSQGTVQRWCKDHVEFAREMQRGGDLADAEVAKALHRKAVGFTQKHKEVVRSYKGTSKVVDVEKYFPPDTAAIKFYLTNRQKDKWTETTKMEKTTNINVNRGLDLSKVPTEELLMAERLGMRKLMKDIKDKN
jgi:hypothetical protein